MKICFVINSFGKGGAERVICSLASFFASLDNEVDIITFSESEKPYSIHKDVNVHFLINKKEEKECKRFKRMYEYRKALKRYLLKNSFDCYIVFLPIASFLVLSLRKMIKAPILVSERNDYQSYRPIIKLLIKYFSRNADGFIFQTDQAKKDYSSFIHKKPAKVIPNAISDVFLHPIVKTKEKQILSVGRLNRQKNFPLLINVFSKIHNVYPEYKLIILGEGEERKNIEGIIARENLQKSVFMPGRVDNVMDYLLESELFVLSSDYEGMPNALIEAMAVGLPCVSTDCPCGGPRFLIQNEINGLLVPVDNEDFMVRAILRLLEDSGFAYKLGEKAKNITERLSPQKINHEWYQLVESSIDIYRRSNINGDK